MVKKHLHLTFGIPSISTIRRVIAIINLKDLELLCNNIFFKYIKKKENIYSNEEITIQDIYFLYGKTINS